MPFPSDPEPATFEVFGALCKSAFVDIPAVFGPAHVVTTDAGTTEFTRVYFYDGHFQMGQGNDKLGPCKILKAVLSENGLHLFAHDGRRLWLPANVLRVTYTPA